MLLIGSRAAKQHFSSFRQPKDYDFIASWPEVESFLNQYEWKNTSTHEKKIRARVKLPHMVKSFEFELTEYSPSGLAMVNDPINCQQNIQDNKLNLTYYVAAPETLFLLKKSHICFNIHWKKNMYDYLYLKERVDQNIINNDLFQLRFKEVQQRIKYKDRNFDVENSDFFKVSEKMVKRIVSHDNIHFATCFYDRPLFMEVKDDLSKAAMNPEKVFNLSYQKRIQLIQEECMALAIERNILPLAKDGLPFDSRRAYLDMAPRMITNYLPMFLRLFAVDNFLEILDLKVDYAKLFIENVVSLDKKLILRWQDNQKANTI